MKESAAEQNQRDQSQSSSQVDKLLKIAGEAQELAFRISSESETHRIAGRLSRLAQFPGSELTDRELGALATAYVDRTISGNNLFADYPIHFLWLHCCIAQVSYLTWEELWNEKHPDRYGKAWEDQDFDLMDVWREKVCGVLKRCGQDAVLAFAFTAEEYATQLISAGASDQVVDGLIDWMSKVRSEGTTGSS